MFNLIILTAINVVSDSLNAPEVITSGENAIFINWTQVAIDLFVTFVGVGLAIIGERITNWIKIRRETRELKKLIKAELEKIFNDLKNFNEETLDVQPLRVPSWESAVNIGQVSLFDIVTRNKLFCVYNTINEFNSWCLIHTNYYFEKGQQNKLLIKELNNIKKKLLSNESHESDSSIKGAIEILERG